MVIPHEREGKVLDLTNDLEILCGSAVFFFSLPENGQMILFQGT